MSVKEIIWLSILFILSSIGYIMFTVRSRREKANINKRKSLPKEIPPKEHDKDFIRGFSIEYKGHNIIIELYKQGNDHLTGEQIIKVLSKTKGQYVQCSSQYSIKIAVDKFINESKLYIDNIENSANIIEQVKNMHL